MKRYPEYYEHVQGLVGRLGSEVRGTMAGFSFKERALSEGALSTKVKELIALSIPVVVRCDGCISFHAHGSLEGGAKREEAQNDRRREEPAPLLSREQVQ